MNELTDTFGQRLTGLVGVLFVAAGCSNEPRDGIANAPRNLLIVSVDTLRADALGLYGYGRPTSPHIDEAASSAFVFERAYSTSSWTLPAMASLMTSEDPRTHGCVAKKRKLPQHFETVAEVLAAADFATGAVTSHLFISKDYGFDQGFELFDEELMHESMDAPHRAISSPGITERGVRWLRARAAEPDASRWFLWLHYFDPHRNYLPHPGISKSFGRDEMRSLYDGEIAFTDVHIGHLFQELASLGLEDDTLVVFVADHGEEFQEHGDWGHGKALYEEVVRIPLWMRVPGHQGERIESPVSIVDIMPTVLELLDVRAPAVAGTSLAPTMTGTAHVERGPVLLKLEDSGLEGIVSGNWKLVRDVNTGVAELFDSSVDRYDQNDLAAAQPARVTTLLQALERETIQAESRSRGLGNHEATDEQLKALEDLGYVGDD